MSWETLRKKVLERDKYKCVACGSEEDLHVHHLSGSSKKIVPMESLITLCKECHEIAHYAESRLFSLSPHSVTPLLKSRIIKTLQGLRDSGYRAYISIFYSEKPFYKKHLFCHLHIRRKQRRGKKDQKPMVTVTGFVKRIARKEYECDRCQKKIKKGKRFYRPRDLKKEKPTFHEKCVLGAFHKLE